MATVAVYLPALFAGYLSDDFVFLALARDGWSALLEALTGGASPRFVRPLAAPYWMLAIEDRSGVLAHALSLAVHVANVLLLRALLVRRTSSGSISGWGAALFAGAPWISEAVAWPSGIFDLSATFFCLGGLVLLDRSRDAASLFAFVAALLSKESVLLVPLVLPLLGHRRRIAWLWGGASITYLIARWLAFDGLGGYPVTPGDVGAAARALPVTLLVAADPLRIVTAPIPLPVALGVVALCLAILLYAGRPLIGGLGSAARAGFGVVVVAAPVLPILYLSPEHAGGRLLYLPLAVGIVLLAAGRRSQPAGPAPGRPAAMLLLAAVWSLGTATHSLDWLRAGREVRTALAAVEDRRLAGAGLVLVDAPDQLNGAYVFRNGLDEAVELATGIRSATRHLRGTAARLGPDGGRRLGEDVMSIAIEGGELHDLTRWEKALWRASATGMTLDGEHRREVRLRLGGGAPTRRYLAVRLVELVCTHRGTRRGSLYWRRPGREHFFDDERSRDLAVPARAPVLATWLGVSPADEGPSSLELRLDLPGRCTGRMSIEEVDPPGGEAIHRRPGR